VELNRKWGCIDKSGKEVIKPKYDEKFSFSDGLAIVKKDDKYGIINKSEKEVLDIEYDNLIKFENNTILILKGDKLAALIMD